MPIGTRIVGALARWVRLRNSPNRSKPPLLNAEIEWKTPHQAAVAGSSPCRRKAAASTSAPPTSQMSVNTATRRTRSVTLPSCGTPPAACTRSRSLRLVRRPTRSRRKIVEPVMNANPPSCMSPRMTTCPNGLQWVAVSDEDEPGRRGGRGRGEQRVEKCRVLAVGGRERERQEDGPDRGDHEQPDDQDDPRRARPPNRARAAEEIVPRAAAASDHSRSLATARPRLARRREPRASPVKGERADCTGGSGQTRTANSRAKTPTPLAPSRLGGRGACLALDRVPCRARQRRRSHHPHGGCDCSCAVSSPRAQGLVEWRGPRPAARRRSRSTCRDRCERPSIVWLGRGGRGLVQPSRRARQHRCIGVPPRDANDPHRRGEVSGAGCAGDPGRFRSKDPTRHRDRPPAWMGGP